jgi:hypothetical protein
MNHRFSNTDSSTHPTHSNFIRQSPHTTIHNEFQGTTARIMPQVRGDFGYGYQNTPVNNNLQPEEVLPISNHISQPQPANVKTYETFETPSNITHPFYFAEQQQAELLNQLNQNTNCPSCVIGKAKFQLPNDPTDSVFCSSCRQPYHFCRIHGKALSGMGRNLRDPQIQECQCKRNQSFLQQENWNSCFNK